MSHLRQSAVRQSDTPVPGNPRGEHGRRRAKGQISESQLKNKIAEFLKEKGFFYRRFAGSPFTRAGIPDFFVLLPTGRAAWIEVKAPGRYPNPWLGCLRDSPAQWHFLTDVNTGGGLALCVDSLESVKAVLLTV